MTLEEKLKKMGYCLYDSARSISIYKKKDCGFFEEPTTIVLCKGKIVHYYLQTNINIYNQQDIDYLQIAFNNLKRDVKEIGNWLKEN